MMASVYSVFSVAILGFAFPLNMHFLPVTEAAFSSECQYIHNIISNRFQDCEILYVAPRYSKRVQQGAQLNIDHRVSEISSGMFIATIGTNVTFKRFDDVHRRVGKFCGVVLISIPEYSQELSTWLFETLTPPYVPIIRKDEDHFIFSCANSEDCDKILLSEQFGNKIKYKISINAKQEHSSTLLLKTVDLYGNHGNPMLVTLPRDTLTLFQDTTGNFQGKVFRVSNPRTKTYFDVDVNEDGKSVGKRGLYKIWLDVMMERFNFSCDVFESSLSGGSGKQLPNGTWGGTVGDVMYGSADMGAFVGHTYNRHKLVGYSATITYEWMFFITHKPRTYYTSTAIFRPLSLALWIGFLVSLLAIGGALKLILKSELNLMRFMNFAYASFIEQDASYYINLNGSPTRVLVTFWLMFSLVFSTAYRGKLVSLIAFPMSSWVPWTYEDLAYSDFRVGLHVVGKGGAADSIFSSSSNPVFRMLNSRMEIFSDPTHCMKEAMTKDIACVLWKCHFEYGLHDGFTDKFGRSPFHTSTQTSYFLHDGFIWEQRAIFRHRIDRAGWSILETGITLYWLLSDHKEVVKMRFDRETNASNNNNGTNPMKTADFIEDDGPSKLKLVQFKGLLILYACGMFLGGAGLAWELKRKKGKNFSFRKCTNW